MKTVLKFTISLFLLSVSIIMCVGCSQYARCDGAGFSTGYKPTPEQLSSLSDVIFNSSNPNDIPTGNGEQLFYWTSGGGKLHLFEDCSHIKSSSSVDSGDIEHIVESGKSEICSNCLERAGKTAEDFDIFKASSSSDTETQIPTESTPPMEITENTVYYWTESGTKFHIFKDCHYITNSQKELMSGKLDEAKSSKKDGICSACIDRSGLTLEDFS